MAHRVVTVTPEQARAWLRDGWPNRGIEMSKVRSLVAVMGAGQWTGGAAGADPLWFTGPRLSDGQHRLLALLLHNRPLPMAIAGLPEESDALASRLTSAEHPGRPGTP